MTAALGKFYFNRMCPFAMRARIALFETVWKGVPAGERDAVVQAVEVDLINKPAWYLEMYPAGKVPMFKFSDPQRRMLVESDILAQYFLEEFSEPVNAGLSPYDRALARLFVSQAAGPVIQAFGTVMHGKTREDRMEGLKKTAAAVENVNALLEAGPNATGDYYLPAGFSTADLLVITFFTLFEAVGKFFNVTVLDLANPKLARLRRWYEACTSRDSLKAVMIPVEDSVRHYQARFPH